MPVAWDGPYCLYLHCGDDGRRARPWRLPMRRLAHYLLVAVLDGREAITVEGRDYEIPTHGVYLIPPGSLHTLASPAANQPAWLHFDVRYDPRRANHPYAGAYESDLGSRRSLLQPSPREVWGVDLPVRLPSELESLFGRAIPAIIAAWRRGGAIDILEANHQLAGVLLSWLAQVKRAEQGPSDLEARVARAEAVAARSLGAAFGVEAFAAAAGYSRSRFCAIYSRLRGVSPGSHLRRERLRQACTLLERPEMTVAAVGSLVGYGDPTVFGRVFRTQFGCTPGAWRERPASRR